MKGKTVDFWSLVKVATFVEKIQHLSVLKVWNAAALLALCLSVGASYQPQVQHPLHPWQKSAWLWGRLGGDQGFHVHSTGQGCAVPHPPPAQRSRSSGRGVLGRHGQTMGDVDVWRWWWQSRSTIEALRRAHALLPVCSLRPISVPGDFRAYPSAASLVVCVTAGQYLSVVPARFHIWAHFAVFLVALQHRLFSCYSAQSTNWWTLKFLFFPCSPAIV